MINHSFKSITVDRREALGDTIALAPFYNYLLSEGIDVKLNTNNQYKIYHKKLNFNNRDTDYYLDLQQYDKLNPNIPLYHLGFHALNLNTPDKLDFSIENNFIKDIKPYILVANSAIWVKSRRAFFTIPKEIEKKYQIIYLDKLIDPNLFIFYIKNATCVIGRDSAPMHFAQAYNTPFISIMSSVKGDLRYKHGVCLSNVCPYGTPHCYHVNWDKGSCPTESYIPPCGIIDEATILESFKIIGVKF